MVCLDLYQEYMSKSAYKNSHDVKRKMADNFLLDFNWKH